jgi:hypothetical protein
VLVLALAVCSCGTEVSGSPLPDAGDAPGSVPTGQLNVGNYPTTPSPPLGLAGSPEAGAIVEAQRMANNVIGPWEVDPVLTTGYATGALVRKNTKALKFMMPEAVAAAAGPHSFINGFFSSREQTGQKILQNAVLRFLDPAAATAAARDMGAAALQEKVITPPVTSVPIPGHPDAIAVSHVLNQPRLQWTIVRSFTAHGPYVLAQLAQGVTGVDPVPLVAKSIDLQGPLIGQFAATAPAEFAEPPIDPTGLLARTLPLPATSATVNQRAVYQPRGALHFQSNPVRSSLVFAEAGLDLVAMGKSTVYQAADAAGADRIAGASSPKHRLWTRLWTVWSPCPPAVVCGWPRTRAFTV